MSACWKTFATCQPLASLHIQNESKVGFKCSWFPFSTKITVFTQRKRLANLTISQNQPQLNSNLPSKEAVKHEPLILPPIPEVISRSKTEKPVALLVFIQGAFIDAKAYVPLLKAVQEEAVDLNLWIGILCCANNIPSETEIRFQFAELKERLSSTNCFKVNVSSQVYFAGHSMGAYLGRIPALHLARGFIQMGSWFPFEEDSLLEYPKPVLTIGGERDGQIGLQIFAREAGEVEKGKQKLGDAYLTANKPVVIISGMNHAQFSDGKLNKQRGDWEATVCIEAAQRKVAQVVALFLSVQIFKSSESEYGSNFKALRERVEESKKLLRPFWEALDREKEGWEGLQEYLLGQVGHALNSARFEFTCHVLWHRFKDNFAYSEPWIDEKAKSLYIQAMLTTPEGQYKQSHFLSVKLWSPGASTISFGVQGSGLNNSKSTF